MSSQPLHKFGDGTEPIAIVGMACRFPGEASTLTGFWDMIVNGRTGHSPVPEDRFDADAIDRLETILQGDGHFARKLRVQVAYHSPHMQTVADAFLQTLGSVQTKQSDIPMFSPVTEKLIEDPTVLGASMTASPDDIDVEKPLYAFGIDSLKAIEVRNWIFNELKADLSIFEVLSPVPLSRLAMQIVAKSSLVSAKVKTEATAEI